MLTHGGSERRSLLVRVGRLLGRWEELVDMLLGIEAMVDPAAAHIVLQIENVIQRRHQVTDIFRRGPTLLVKFHNPVQHFGGVVHLAEGEPIVMRAVIVDGSPVPVELPFAPLFRKRFAEKPVQNFDDRMEPVGIGFGHA